MPRRRQLTRRTSRRAGVLRRSRYQPLTQQLHVTAAPHPCDRQSRVDDHSPGRSQHGRAVSAAMLAQAFGCIASLLARYR